MSVILFFHWKCHCILLTDFSSTRNSTIELIIKLRFLNCYATISFLNKVIYNYLKVVKIQRHMLWSTVNIPLLARHFKFTFSCRRFTSLIRQIDDLGPLYVEYSIAFVICIRPNETVALLFLSLWQYHFLLHNILFIPQDVLSKNHYSIYIFHRDISYFSFSASFWKTKSHFGITKNNLKFPNAFQHLW